MASTPPLFLRILQAVIHKLWSVLFFLCALSVTCLTNHWWDRIVTGYLCLEQWILHGIELLRG